MFVQVIKGRTSDPAALRQQTERWRDDVRPGARGFLGSTAGAADDGTFIVFARFDNEDSARKNSARAEQGAWWEETARYFEGEPNFRESGDVAIVLDGGSDSAGFVQVMEGKVTDRARAESFETAEMLEQLRAARPDLIGSVRVWFADGRFAEAAYFTSQEDARAGESSTEFAGPQQEYMDLYDEMTFLDIPDPIFA